jgi:hypothetical protein
VTTGQRFVVVWNSSVQDGSGVGVFGRRFVVPLTLDVDGDGSVLPLTDSLLILRYTFGFRGATLITGAVERPARGATRPRSRRIWGRSRLLPVGGRRW